MSRVLYLLTNTPHFSEVTMPQVYFLLIFYVSLALALALLSAFFSLELSLMKPLSGTLSDLWQEEKRNNWHHKLAFEASSQRQWMSFLLPLLCPYKWHGTQQGRCCTYAVLPIFLLEEALLVPWPTLISMGKEV